MPISNIFLSISALAFAALIAGCSGGGSSSSSGDTSTGGGTSPLLLASVVYDDNKTETPGDDRLDIYFSMPVDATSLPADISSAFEITGAGVISADSLYSYSGGWPYRLRIELGALSTAFEPGSTAIALAQEVIADENFEYPAAYSVKTVTASRTLLKTAQTISYTAGDDGDYQSGRAHSYERNATTGIVSDLSRGLQWLDVNTTADMSWSDAITHCTGETAGNLFEWRLPSIEELTQLSEKNTTSPAVDGIFENIAIGSYVYYWSDTPVDFDSSRAWAYSYDISGYDGEVLKTGAEKVLCVHGTRTSSGEFVRNDINATVLDTTAGLLWQDNIASGETSWADAITYCESSLNGYGGFFDWRLPNYNELSLLAERTLTKPAISDAFNSNNIHADTAEDIYWSSTTKPDTTSMAFGVTFSSGDGVVNFKTDTATHYVRCVRNIE